MMFSSSVNWEGYLPNNTFKIVVLDNDFLFVIFCFVFSV